MVRSSHQFVSVKSERNTPSPVPESTEDSFGSPTDLEAHLVNGARFELQDQQQQDPCNMDDIVEDSKLKPRHPCAVCHKWFALRSTWHEHMRRAHGITKPFECEECGKRYSMLGALNYHRLTTHRGVVHACKTCGKRFMTKPGLVRHAKSHFGGVYLCEDCEKTYPTRDSLRRHRQQVHMGEKPHVCQFCQEKFGASHSLKRHIKRRHQPKLASSEDNSSASEEPRHLQFTCETCRKPFQSAEALRKHVQSMHQHARYQCDTCLRRFSDWSNLNRHRKSTKGCMPAIRDDAQDDIKEESIDIKEEPLDVQLTPDDPPVAAAVPLIVPVVIQQLDLEGNPAPVPSEPSLAQLPVVVSTVPQVLPSPPPTAVTAAQSSEIELSAAEDSSEFDVKTEQEPDADGTPHSTSATDDEFAEFARRYGTEEACLAAAAAPDSDHVELQPVNAAELRELRDLEPPLAAEETVILPLNLADPLSACGSGSGQDVYVTLYPAGQSSGHRFICVQEGEHTVFTEAPLVGEQVLDVN